MNKRCCLLILFATCGMTISNGQCCNTSAFHNYFLVDSTGISNETVKSSEGALKIVFYPDSIPPSKWLEPKYATIVYMINPVTKTIGENETTYVANQWAQIMDSKKLRVLSIINTSNIQQKFFMMHDDALSSYLVMAQQAQDEMGNWKDIEKLNIKSKYPNYSKFYLKPHGVLNSVIEIPEGDFETKIRIKMLANAPPDYPTEKYIYSKPFNGRINKALLK